MCPVQTISFNPHDGFNPVLHRTVLTVPLPTPLPGGNPEMTRSRGIPSRPEKRVSRRALDQTLFFLAHYTPGTRLLV